MHDTAWTASVGFTVSHSLDGATLLLPSEVTGATCKQYLDLAFNFEFGDLVQYFHEPLWRVSLN